MYICVSVNPIPVYYRECSSPEDRANDENSDWIKDDENLGSGNIGKIPDSEKEFLIAFIEKYLKPLDKDKEKEERIAIQLKGLRNKMSAAFLLGNAMLVITLLVVQLNNLLLPWFCGSLKMEPIGLVFLIFYGFVILLQTAGMLIHRIGTILHIMAAVIFPCRHKPDPTSSKLVSDAELEDEKELCSLSRDVEIAEDEGSTADSTDDEQDGPGWHRSLGARNLNSLLRDKQSPYSTIGGAHEHRVEKYEQDTNKKPEESIGNAPNDGDMGVMGSGQRRRRSTGASRLRQSEIRRKSFLAAVAQARDNETDNGSSDPDSESGGSSSHDKKHEVTYENPSFTGDTDL